MGITIDVQITWHRLAQSFSEAVTCAGIENH